MVKCFEPRCTVDSETGTLTIFTKDGICSVTPGDDVTFTETENAYVITINGAVNSIPKIEPGDDVSFTETTDNYVITINNEPHLIPKCRYYRDCEGNVLDQCARIVTCDDLESRGYITCYDDDDFNIVPRMVGGEAVECLTIAWDNICAEAETITNMGDDGFVIVCVDGSLRKIDVSSMISGQCLDVEDSADTCGTKLQAVWTQCAGGYKLQLYNPATAVSFTANGFNLPWRTPGQTAIWPTDPTFQVNGGPYTVTEFVALDDGTPTVFIEDTVDEVRLRNNILMQGSIELACATRFTGQDVIGSAQGGYAGSADAAFSASTTVFFRWRVDGGAWVYPRNPITNVISNRYAFNGLDKTVTGPGELIINFPAGDIDFQYMFFPPDAPATPATITANTHTPQTTGTTSFPRMQFYETVN